MCKNVKILKYSKKIRVTPIDPKDPSTTIFKPLNPLLNIFEVNTLTFFGPVGPPKFFRGLKRVVEGP